jgi:GDP/UDP-N,N'-diacetylbacillosamine 2-epimerase (hydrolysing)
MGNALIKFADYFKKNRPDIIIVLGDRYEIMAVCCAAVNERIPIAHIHGGETTLGAVDDCYRHSITKMSALHFTSCEAYRNRVIQLGEHPDKVFSVGALSVENILTTQLMTIEELEYDLGLTLSDKPYAVVTFHPVTLECNTGAAQLKELLKSLDAYPDMRFVITKANSDAGGREINRLLDEYGKERENCYIVASLGMQRYLSALKNSCVIIGNSSSGVIEGPAMKIPTVNIGDRQKGRIMADSVICCQPFTANIKNAIDKAISPEFKEASKHAEHPFGDGNVTEKIVRIIKSMPITEELVKKSFYDCI